jgi:hypothetical protein
MTQGSLPKALPFAVGGGIKIAPLPKPLVWERLDGTPCKNNNYFSGINKSHMSQY